MRHTWFLWLVLGVGCTASEEPCTDEDQFLVWDDSDGDGYGDPTTARFTCDASKNTVRNGVDCDDTDPMVHPFQPDVCNGIDDDCDNRIDERLLELPFWPDNDGDGQGDGTLEPVTACAAPEGYAPDGIDCDDTNPDVYVDNVERCNGIDDDCDGAIDNDDDSVDPADLITTWSDQDGDGYGDPTTGQDTCDGTPGRVANDEDCNDGNPYINPLASEECNGIDDDCDTLIDDDDPDVDPATFLIFYEDTDADGLGDSASTIEACIPPAGFVANDLDCDDTDPAIGGPSDWLFDADGDGVGGLPPLATSCTSPGPDYTDAGALVDCNDSDPYQSPLATEVCNGIDDDCDGAIDDADPSLDLNTASVWFADNDNDGSGATGSYILACSQPPGTAADNLDCDDSDFNISPWEQEVCSGIDEDCDGLIDEADPDLDPLSLTLWYGDSDGDGYGTVLDVVATCDPPPGYVAEPTDCDDNDPNLGSPSLWVEDLDGDGTGAGTVSGPSCSPPGPTWTRVGDALDCDDSDPNVSPEMAEIRCDGIDQDCDFRDECELLIEDFESGVLDPVRWTTANGDGGIDTSQVFGGTFALNLGGGGSEFRTVPLDASSCGGVFWSYMGKRGPETPDVGDSMSLQWFDGVSWVEADFWEGNGTTDNGFSYRSGSIVDPLVNQPLLQVRLVSDGSGTGFDDFFVDDLLMECL